MKPFEWLWALLIAAIVLGGIVGTWKQSKACSESGGVLVRGIMWYECVRK